MNQIDFKKRRDRLCQQIGESGVAILFAAKECLRNKNHFYPYRQDSDFYYLTGFKEPEAIAILLPNRQEGEFILFNRESNPVKEVWYGKRAGQEGAYKDYGADQVFAINLASTMIPQLIAGRKKVYFNINQATTSQVANWFEQLTRKGTTGVDEPGEFIHIGTITHNLRIYKDPEEIILMKKAANIIAQAQCRVMRACRPNLREYDLEAEILYECVKNGARFQSFESIVASGANSCILHYVANDASLKNGELVLVDCGAEYQFYASDITRTIPINGRFNQEQRAIYQAVLDIQLAVLNQVKPKVSWIELQQLSERVATQKLLALGLLQGNLEELIANQAFLPFFPHKIGHWIGLDVHDVGWYKNNDKWRELEVGMLMTIEPGIYIANHLPNIDPKWHNIGVRIEDTVLITESGCEVLTGEAPKTLNEIERFMVSSL
jgi:Xaa-Pro aminopeptidase